MGLKKELNSWEETSFHRPNFLIIMLRLNLTDIP